jgi:hypothetical protein
MAAFALYDQVIVRSDPEMIQRPPEITGAVNKRLSMSGQEVSQFLCVPSRKGSLYHCEHLHSNSRGVPGRVGSWRSSSPLGMHAVVDGRLFFLLL